MILKDLISGSAITTFGLPPYLINLASASPNVLETYNDLKFRKIMNYI